MIAWASKLTKEYEGEVRVKQAEQTKARRGQLKDSLRLSLLELAEIHYKNGFIDDAIIAYQQSFENCT